MNRHACCFFVGIFLLLIQAASAAKIPGCFNTGVNDQRIPLLPDATDTHYQLVMSTDQRYPAPRQAVVANASLAAGWIASSDKACWIGPHTNQLGGSADVQAQNI